MTETRIFLNTWGAYNNGCIGYGWMTADEAEAIQEAERQEKAGTVPRYAWRDYKTVEQITPGTLTASSKKRRKITVTFYKLKNSGLFVEPRKIKGALLSAPGSMGKRCARGKIYVYNIHFCILLTAPALLVYTMGD